MVTNFIKVQDSLILGRGYIFIDTADHYYRQIMKKNGIILRRVKEYIKGESPFRLISCYVGKNDEKLFLNGIKQLRNIIILMGYKGYDDLCFRMNTLSMI